MCHRHVTHPEDQTLLDQDQGFQSYKFESKLYQRYVDMHKYMEMDMQWNSPVHVHVDNLMQKLEITNGFWIHIFWDLYYKSDITEWN